MLGDINAAIFLYMMTDFSKIWGASTDKRSGQARGDRPLELRHTACTVTHRACNQVFRFAAIIAALKGEDQ
jgi:hypothetical protein